MEKGSRYGAGLSPEDLKSPDNEGEVKDSTTKKKLSRKTRRKLARVTGIEAQRADKSDSDKSVEPAPEEPKKDADKLAGVLHDLLGVSKEDEEETAEDDEAVVQAENGKAAKEAVFDKENWPVVLPLDRLNVSEVIIDLGHPVAVREAIPSVKEGQVARSVITETGPAAEPLRVPEEQTEQGNGVYEQVPSTSAPEAAADDGGEQPPIPPIPPEGSAPFAAQPPEGDPQWQYYDRPEPAQVYREYIEERDAITRTAAANAPAEPTVTKQEADDQAYYAEKRGLSRGVASGVLLGGLYEHYKHKRREKKTAKKHKTVVHGLKKEQEKQKWDIKAQDQKQVETDRQLQQTEAQLAAAGNRPQFKPLSAYEAARMAEQQAQEQLRAQQAPESQRQPVRAAEAPAEKLEIPREHRLEASAWHSIEIDARTGRPVEMPTFQYGHEYYRERAQEATPIGRRNAAAGEVALVAAAHADSHAQSIAGSQPPAAQLPSANRQGSPSSHSDDSQSRHSNGSNSTNALWPYLAALVSIGILLYLALS